MHIVILDGQTLNPGDLSWEWLNEFGSFEVFSATSAEMLMERARKAAVLLVNKVVIDAPLLEKLPELKYIVVTATGYNNVDVSACRTAGIPVSNVINYGSTTVAQHVFALILALTNRVSKHQRLVQQGAWANSNSFSFWDAPLIELSGKTLGIIGMGNIGREAARIARGFRMEVVYSSSGDRGIDGAKRLDGGDLIRVSDVISLHTHLNEFNREMVDRKFLEQMKDSAYLINTARGGLINEADLYTALNEKWIAGAGLDVLTTEPPPTDHPLLHLDNCIVTPHNAWASVDARQRMMNIVRDNLRAWLAGKPIHLVN